MSPRLATALIAACALISLCTYGANNSARALEIPFSRLEMTFHPSVTPKKLSRVEATPIALDIDGRIGTVDGSRPPAVREIVLDLDRHIAIHARGLPVCQGGQRDVRFPDLKSRCKNAIVGRGRVGFQIQFPEQPSIPTESELVVFNGGGQRTGETKLYAVAYLTQPITTSFVMAISIRRRSDWSRLIFDVPKLANDAGSLTHLSFKLKRRFARNGEAVDLLTGRCPGGTIQSRVKALFGDGTILQADTLQTCVPKSG
jgi:hypothetical protein